MPFSPEETAEMLAENLTHRLKQSTPISEWNIWRWKNERLGVVNAIEKSVKSILTDMLEETQYQFLSQEIVEESLTKSFSSKKAIKDIGDFLAAVVPSRLSPHSIQTNKAEAQFSDSYQDFIKDQVDKAMNDAMIEEGRIITQAITKSLKDASQIEISEPVGLYDVISTPVYPNMGGYYNELDGVAEAIGEIVIEKLKLGVPKDSFDIEIFQESFTEKINSKEILNLVEEFLAHNARKSLMSGIGKDATRKIFLGNLPMRNSINRIIDEAIEISRSGSTIEEGLDNIDGQATPSDDGNEITEDEDLERTIRATPEIPPTDFGNVSFINFEKKMLNYVNDNRQNIVHHFTLNNNTFHADSFSLLLNDRRISEKDKNKIRELANQSDNKGMTPMHYAAINVDIPWMAALGGDLIKADQTGRTPIDYMLDHKNPELVEEFIKQCLEGDVNRDLGETRKDLGKGTTLSHCIAKHPFGYMYTDILAEHKANLHAQNIHGDTPLMSAASAGKIENIYCILDAAAEIVSSETHDKNKIQQEQLELLQMKNNDGKEAIHLLVASRPGIKISHLKKLAELQSHSGSALGTLDDEGNNIAHILAEAKSTSELLKKTELKPLLTVKNNRGQTPINVLLNHQRQTNNYKNNLVKDRDQTFIQQVEELFRKNPEVLSTPADNNGDSLIHYIARNGYYELLPTVVQKATMERIANKKGQTPLILAAMYGHDQMVAELLERYPDQVNIQDKYGNTALHYAAINGNIETIRRLAFVGANPYLLSKAGTVKDTITGKYKPMETVFDILDRYKGRANNPAEDEKITSAMAMLALNAGVSEQLKKYQKKRVDKALESIGKGLASEIYEVVKKFPRDQTDFCKEISEITTKLLADKRAVTAEENLAFSAELNKALEPIYKDMKKFEDAKNYDTKYKWNLVMRLIDCIANTLTIIGYGIWGLGRPENKILYMAKKTVTAKLDDLSKGRLRPDKEEEHIELIALGRRALKTGIKLQENGTKSQQSITGLPKKTSKHVKT